MFKKKTIFLILQHCKWKTTVAHICVYKQWFECLFVITLTSVVYGKLRLKQLFKNHS